MAVCLVLASVALTPASSSAHAESAASDVRGNPSGRRWIVGVARGNRWIARRAIVAGGARVLDFDPDGHFFVVDAPSLAAISGVRADAAVTFVERDRIVSAVRHQG